MKLAVALKRLGARPARPKIMLRLETLALIISAWFTVACNALFWQSLPAPSPAMVIAIALIVTAIHFAILTALVVRRTAKPVFALLIIVTAVAASFMERYHVHLDRAMLRNVLHTDWAEAKELLSWGLLPPLMLYALPPLVLLWKTDIAPEAAVEALARRLLAITIAILVAGGAILATFKDLSTTFRQERALRFLITPGNYLYSLVSEAAAALERRGDNARMPIGSDAVRTAANRQGNKPTLLIIVVGETARAANWGLSGYVRQTTPQLAKEKVINFSDVTACGTDTETSVPCMFSPLGRHAYDERRIRGSESLLHVLQRAGFRVVWLDNQSGCKGVCAGIEQWRPQDDPTLPKDDCNADRCLDMALLYGAGKLLSGQTPRHTVLVFHQLGNHGPAYYRRYPPQFERFAPACKNDDLRRCPREEIVNAYDNALLYTDHLLASTLAFLREREATYETLLLYVSDHGESLGENGLFLHGMPYVIAPREQTGVPMLLWLSEGYQANSGLSMSCLKQRQDSRLSHDFLFHSVLGLLDISTRIYDEAYDFTSDCRKASRAVEATTFSSATGG